MMVMVPDDSAQLLWIWDVKTQGFTYVESRDVEVAGETMCTLLPRNLQELSRGFEWV